MLGSVTGYLGSGKTLLLTSFAYANRKKDVYANFTIRLPNVKQITIEDLGDIGHGLLLIDEAYIWLESRLSSSAMNRYLSRLIFQSRKRNFDVFISSQLHSAIDLRFRHLEDLRVYALGPTIDGESFEYVFEGFGSFRWFHLPMTTATKLFKLFDTFEYPDVTPTSFEPIKYNKLVQEHVDNIVLKYKDNAVKLTRRMVEDIMIEKGVSSTDIAEAVYSRLKRTKFLPSLSTS